MVYHIHLMINASTNKQLTSCTKMNAWLQSLVKHIDMKEVIAPRSFYVNKEGNKGITAQIGIETSHVALHVWDEPSPSIIKMDLYTCGCLNVKRTLKFITKGLGLINIEYLVLDRAKGFNTVNKGRQ